jgi:hypothetical protein
MQNTDSSTPACQQHRQHTQQYHCQQIEYCTTKDSSAQASCNMLHAHAGCWQTQNSQQAQPHVGVGMCLLQLQLKPVYAMQHPATPSTYQKNWWCTRVMPMPPAATPRAHSHPGHTGVPGGATAMRCSQDRYCRRITGELSLHSSNSQSTVRCIRLQETTRSAAGHLTAQSVH